MRDHRCIASLLHEVQPVMKKVVFLQLGQRLAKVKRGIRAGLQKKHGKSGVQCAIRQVGVGMAGCSWQDVALMLIPSNPSGETNGCMTF